MSSKKRDNKGRILRSGERQREDGRYEYRYTDETGKTRSIYSWRLVSSDKNPTGKRSKEALRDMIKKVNRDLEDNVNAYEAYRTSLNSYYDAYISSKVELKQSTRTNYKYMYKKYVQDDIGMKNIAEITYSDIKNFYMHLIHDLGFKPNSMEVIHTILHPVFETAVRDNVIRKNPSAGVMKEIKRTHDWEKTKRHALTEEEQDAFVNYLSENERLERWRTLFTVLLGTGGRVGEILGLRWEDCDFKNRLITIDHSLIYRLQEDGKCRYVITTPKTKAGIRIIPMLSEVYDALLEERKKQMLNNSFNRSVVDGYSGFIFSNRFGDPLNAHNVNRVIERIVKSYNEEELIKATKEDRAPIFLPHFTVHNLRHTFCTRFCENETNLKVIQEIMGHADITTTMDVYNEATKKKKIESFENLDGKIKIS